MKSAAADSFTTQKMAIVSAFVGLLLYCLADTPFAFAWLARMVPHLNVNC